MKSGKVSDTVLNRSVLKEVQGVNHMVPCPRVGGGAAILPENGMVCAMQTVLGEGVNTAYLAAVRAVNSLAAKTAVPQYVSVALTVPEEMDERDLRRMQERLGAYLKEIKTELAGGHTAVSAAVAEPVASVCVYGRIPAEGAGRACEDGENSRTARKAGGKTGETFDADETCQKSRTMAETGGDDTERRKNVDFANEFLGLDVVMTKHCGLGGTALLAGHFKEKLTEKYPKRFIERAEQFLGEIQKNEECFVALQNGAVYAHAAAEGGIFGALWELAEYAGCGLEIALRQISILQETVEICEFFDINPYQLRTEGVFLFLTAHGERLCEKLTEAGVPAIVIGKTVPGLDRAVRNEDEVRYLEPNRVEEYERIRAKGTFVNER